MLQPRISPMSLSRDQALSSLATALNNLALCSRHASRASKRPIQLTFTRHASHAAQGRANGPKDSAGRRLGAKKTSTQYVIPGNIIFKQRGTKWFPGENVGIGKDHTIYSKTYGYVRYYRDPAIHPKRRYIGVALEKEGPGSQLPTPPNAPTRRRLGMYLSPIKSSPGSSADPDTDFLQAHVADTNERPKTIPVPTQAAAQIKSTAPPYALRRGGFGMANHEIGRAAERKGIKVKEFDRKDRWTAWRIRAKKAKEKQLARAAKANRKTKGKKSNKKVKLAA